MKNSNVCRLSKSILTAVLFSLAALVGCERDPEKMIVTQSAQEQTASNYLNFNTLADFYQTVENVDKMSFEQQEAWESGKGFTSLRSLFNKVIAEEANNHERELKMIAADPSSVRKHQPSSTALLLGDMLVTDTQYGGVELNLADHRLAAVLNKDGVVQIGKTLHQFTYDLNKVIVIGSGGDLIARLKGATQSNKKQGLFVYEIKHVKYPIQVPNARPAAYNDVRSCDNANNSEWRVIGYSTEEEGESAEVYPICDAYGNCEYQETPYRYHRLYITVRTLKRGTFGAWYDRQSNLQNVSGSFRITGSLNNNWRSDLNPGQDRPFNPFGLNSYNLSNTGGLTATYQITLLGTYQQWYYQGVFSSNIRFGSGTQHNINWNGDYNCHCNITY